MTALEAERIRPIARKRDAEARSVVTDWYRVEARMWKSAARRWMVFSTLTVMAWIVSEIARAW